jgi:serine/threonine-protein kinase
MKLSELRGPLLTLVLLWIALGAFVWATYGQLPERPATHFALGGNPNGWMTRDGHVKFIMGFAIGLPVALHLMFLVIRKLGGAGVNIPNRSYWLAPERQQATLVHVQRNFAWFICVLVAFFGGVHYVIVNANTRTPPSLSLPLLLSVVGAFLLFKVVWLARLLVPLFRVPKEAT